MKNHAPTRRPAAVPVVKLPPDSYTKTAPRSELPGEFNTFVLPLPVFASSAYLMLPELLYIVN